MPVQTTFLFDLPQKEIASLIRDRLSRSLETHIVSGFATPGGLELIAESIQSNPQSIQTVIIGAATYPAFQALENFISYGVQMDKLFVHLGHTRPTGGNKNPFARFHPMLHSKIYFMRLPDHTTCIFIGSHNLTAFALGGANGEAGVLLEGESESDEFNKVLTHIALARNQSTPYSPSLKEAFSWWTKEFIEGMKAEMKMPKDAELTRTLLVFSHAQEQPIPRVGDEVYFEIPNGIMKIDTLKTDTHIFIFNKLPSNPWLALNQINMAHTKLHCKTLGIDSAQGNLEVETGWRIENQQNPALLPVPSKRYRPNTPNDMQQVRAKVTSYHPGDFEFLFEDERHAWDPIFSSDHGNNLDSNIGSSEVSIKEWHVAIRRNDWNLVTGLKPRSASKSSEEQYNKLVSPDSGSYILLSLRRRKRGSSK